MPRYQLFNNYPFLVFIPSVGFVDESCGSDDPSTLGNTAIVSMKTFLEMYEFTFIV